jgi:hypothetical protein
VLEAHPDQKGVDAVGDEPPRQVKDDEEEGQCGGFLLDVLGSWGLTRDTGRDRSAASTEEEVDPGTRVCADLLVVGAERLDAGIDQCGEALRVEVVVRGS